MPQPVYTFIPSRPTTLHSRTSSLVSSPSASRSNPPSLSQPSSPSSTSALSSRTIPISKASAGLSFTRRRIRGIVWTALLLGVLGWIGYYSRDRGPSIEGTTVEGGKVANWGNMLFTKVRKTTNPSTARFVDGQVSFEEEEDDETELTTTVESTEDEKETLTALPFCRKTFLFRFAGLHGQGSELNLLLRLSALSTHFGYTFLTDSSSWNYGPFSSYFTPLSPVLPLPFPSNGRASLRCRPPGPRTKRVKVRLTANDLEQIEKRSGGDGNEDFEEKSWRPDWTERNHVVWGPTRDMDGLDSTILRLFADQEQLNLLHDRDLKSLDAVPEESDRGKPLGGELEPNETIPEAFQEAFDRLADEAKKVWRITSEIAEDVERSAARLGLSGGTGETRSTPAKEVGDLTVGVHVRLGDKYLEADRIGPQALLPNSSLATDPSTNPSPYSSSYTAQPGLRQDLVTSYLAAAIKSVNTFFPPPPNEDSVTAPTTTSPSTERIEYLLELSSHWNIDTERDRTRPTLILMSDDSAAVNQFKLHPLARRFRIVSTVETSLASSLTQATEKRGKRMEKVVVASRRVKSDRRKRQVDDGRGHGRIGGTHWKLVHHAKEGVNDVGSKVPEIPAGFNENTFNSLPLADRIAQAKLFVRDVTLLSSRCDALVITGSSNVGRLMALLMGSRGKGRIASLDTRWFPTAKFS